MEADYGDNADAGVDQSKNQYEMGLVTTYIPPRAKTIMSAFFCLLGIDNLRRTGIGSRRMTKSCKMFIAALENHTANWFMHLEPSTVLSQNECTGTQRKILPNKPQKPYSVTMPITTQHTMRKRWVGNMRKYWTRIESFVKVRAR